MNDLTRNKWNRLKEITERDRIFNTWEKSFEACRKDFTKFADAQPQEIRSLLYGYADCGRMAQQRLVNLACEYMIFPDEK